MLRLVLAAVLLLVPSVAAAGELVGPKGLTARQIILNLDRDGDGKVSRQEFKGPHQRFRSADTNGDGFLTVAEFEFAGVRLKSRQQGDTAPEKSGEYCARLIKEAEEAIIWVNLHAPIYATLVSNVVEAAWGHFHLKDGDFAH